MPGDHAANNDRRFSATFFRIIFDPDRMIAGDSTESETQFAAILDRYLLEQSSLARQRPPLERSPLGLEAMITGLILQVAEHVFTLAVK